jgi:hypothetical protein
VVLLHGLTNKFWGVLRDERSGVMVVLFHGLTNKFWGVLRDKRSWMIVAILLH